MSDPPCWVRRTRRQGTKSHPRPKDPNIVPFPHFPPIIWTEDYWTRVWDRVIIPGARRNYQMEQMSSAHKERCGQCRVAVHHKKRAEKRRKDGCWGHPGKPVGHGQRFTCCGNNIFSPGCHKYKESKIVHDQVAWKHNWELHEAPPNPVDYRYAVALDCEIGITDLGEQELIRVSAIDFFTGQILLDKLVFPKVWMFHTNFRFSGVSWPILCAARDAGEALNGRGAAREELFKCIGPNTVVVLHGGRGDLLALRIVHHRILDTLRFVGRSLKANAKECLGREIQQGPGHDSLEDALACRDIADYLIKTFPFDHIYGPKYGQMWRSDVLDLDMPMVDGDIDPMWRPPPSENRVPHLKSYRPFEPWVTQENRHRAENLPQHEAAAREWEEQGWKFPGLPLCYQEKCQPQWSWDTDT